MTNRVTFLADPVSVLSSVYDYDDYCDDSPDY